MAEKKQLEAQTADLEKQPAVVKSARKPENSATNERRPPFAMTRRREKANQRGMDLPPGRV
jgi:hypothetical protein